jgi:hypothetical protein
MAVDLSLPVLWTEDDRPATPGRLDVTPAGIVLAGGSREVTIRREVGWREIASVDVARRARERLRGRATVLLALQGGGVLSIAGFERPGAVRELVDLVLQGVAT